jgi:hypothetical protein
MKKRDVLIVSGVLIAAVVLYRIFGMAPAAETQDILTEVKRGQFRVEVETSGELQAKNSIKIIGPSSLRNFGIWQVTIQKIIDEGTVVKKGDWVASLDPSEFQNKYSAKQIELEKASSKFIQTQLDTALQLRQSRDELINLRYAVEEKEIIMEQSKFEPPATQKQAEIDLGKARRAYQQAVENYKIKRDQNIEKMREVAAELRKVQNEFDSMSKTLASFEVTAPETGMVIYQKDWDGKPIKAGSQIQMWEPTVATLPDLSVMLSKTFVNEVDVRKVRPGQKVEIGLDAYPEKRLSGAVISVANVGEQRPNSDSKVFEVNVELEKSDPVLRPGMTTSNKIIAQVIDSVLFVPLECLHSQGDSVTYVFKRDGLSVLKQEVVIGLTNANEAVIEKGLTASDRLYLSVPAGRENDPVRLLPGQSGKRKKKGSEPDPAGVAAANP